MPNKNWKLVYWYLLVFIGIYLYLLDIKKTGFNTDIPWGTQIEGFFKFGAINRHISLVGSKVHLHGVAIIGINHRYRTNRCVSPNALQIGNRIGVPTPTTPHR